MNGHDIKKNLKWFLYKVVAKIHLGCHFILSFSSTVRLFQLHLVSLISNDLFQQLVDFFWIFMTVA